MRLLLAERRRASRPLLARGSSLRVVPGVQCGSQGLFDPGRVIGGLPGMFQTGS